MCSKNMQIILDPVRAASESTQQRLGVSQDAIDASTTIASPVGTIARNVDLATDPSKRTGGGTPIDYLAGGPTAESASHREVGRTFGVGAAAVGAGAALGTGGATNAAGGAAAEVGGVNAAAGATAVGGSSITVTEAIQLMGAIGSLAALATGKPASGRASPDAPAAPEAPPSPSALTEGGRVPTAAELKARKKIGDPTALTGPGGIPFENLTLGRATVLGG